MCVSLFINIFAFHENYADFFTSSSFSFLAPIWCDVADVWNYSAILLLRFWWVSKLCMIASLVELLRKWSGCRLDNNLALVFIYPTLMYEECRLLFIRCGTILDTVEQGGTIHDVLYRALSRPFVPHYTSMTSWCVSLSSPSLVNAYLASIWVFPEGGDSSII